MAAETPPLHGTALALLTLAVGVVTFMQVLDTSIANVAIHSIAIDLGVHPNHGTWIITSFTVSNAVAIPLTGWLARRFGEVRLFVLSALLFTLASWLCGIAPGLAWLIAARVLQGLVAGPMIPLSQSLLLRNFPPERKTFALACWSTVAIVAPIVGPVLGGWITDNLIWRWIFYINLPIGLLGAYVAGRVLRGRETLIVHEPIDKVGLVLLIAVVGTAQATVSRSTGMAWVESSAMVAVSLAALVLLIARELSVPYPVVDLHLFRHRNFLVGSLVLSFGYATFVCNAVIMPLWLQTNMGYTATQAGMVTAPIGIMPLLLTVLLARYLRRVDPRLLGSAAFAIFAVTSYWYSGLDRQVAASEIAFPRLLEGLGVALFFVPLTTLSLAGLPTQSIASASGLITFTRYVGAGIGVSLATMLWEHRAAHHYPSVLDTAQATLLATNDLFLTFAGIFAVLTLLVWLAYPLTVEAA